MLGELFSGQTIFFSVPALVGTFFFIVRLVMSMMGLGDLHGHLDSMGDSGGGSDFGHAAGAAHGDASGTDPHHSTQLFKVLSIQSIAAFLMGFGWGGLGGLRGTGWEFSTSLLCGVAGGVAMVWLLTWLLKLVHDLQSSGTISIQDAALAQGDVYVTVPGQGQGQGQVRVVIDDRQRIYNAVSENQSLPTSTRVRVKCINNDNTVTVEPL